MRIAQVTPQDDGMLYVVAEDGRSGYMDVRPYFESQAFAPLKQRSEFVKVRHGGYFIEWDCGADLSADTIEARWIKPPGQDPRPSHEAAKHGDCR